MGQQSSKPPDRFENAEKTGVYARRAAGLTTVPDKVWSLAMLRTLDLSENKLLTAESIRRLGTLTKLKSLSLDSNKLPSLPAEVCTLKELTSLSVAHNQLAALPEALGALSKLKTLQVSHNSLKSLPESMCAMASLSVLDASANKLQALPAGFGHLDSLVSAAFANNMLGALPAEGLSGLKRLKDLDLRANAPLVVHASAHGLPTELLLATPLHRLEVDAELLDIDGARALARLERIHVARTHLPPLSRIVHTLSCHSGSVCAHCVRVC